MAKRINRNKRRDVLLGLIGLALLIIGFLTSCGPDDAVELSTAQELAFEKLAGEWTLKNGEGSIQLGGSDISMNYPGFSLSYESDTYTTTNAGTLFSASGTWEWLDEEARVIVLDDGKEITLVELTTTSFTFSFNYTGGSRRAGLPGDYVIQVLK
jgi:hypothetical protein